MRFLSSDDVRRLMDFESYVAAVEAGFRAHAEGRTSAPGVLHLATKDGGFHVKAAGLLEPDGLVAIKINGNFPANRERHGLPTIQGVIVLADARCGTPVAVLDSAEITVQRTGAAGAVAAALGARADASVAAICGCGRQGRVQLRALARGRRLAEVRVHDVDREAADAFARDAATEYGVIVRVTTSAREAVRDADLVATCTPSRKAFLFKEDVRPGTFIAAVGADSQGKQELDVEIVAAARVLSESAAQAATMGDSQHAVAAGRMRPEDVVELGDLLVGRARARTSDRDVVVFDSTGTALQDVAAAIEVVRRACARGAGLEVCLG